MIINIYLNSGIPHSSMSNPDSNFPFFIDITAADAGEIAFYYIMRWLYC